MTLVGGLKPQERNQSKKIFTVIRLRGSRIEILVFLVILYYRFQNQLQMPDCCFSSNTMACQSIQQFSSCSGFIFSCQTIFFFKVVHISIHPTAQDGPEIGKSHKLGMEKV